MRAALICIDKKDHIAIRKANREAHLAYIASTGIVEMAGPFLDAEGGMTGSLVILTVDSLAGAEAWAAADPYAKAGLFETVTIQEWKKVVG
ncbi:YciI family protein [Pseudogemmobacter faecipullorum]|uniref:YciI family protein n=1 Tax=Pseudogemmobacter faecipullorum TaxID=2755041 RepID=A0ABS8CJA3_9RHOB|nr:YciI family protein [Pseudogemmobacter faecipullorum]MCB5409436.1 YciI family protein [Pseudogemmobacter faecipullorum]